jgi:hypothetical protein
MSKKEIIEGLFFAGGWAGFLEMTKTGLDIAFIALSVFFVILKIRKFLKKS